MVRAAAESLLEKALKKPGKVKQVIEMVRRHGLWYTYRKVRGVVDRSNPLGYSLSGVVEAVGDGVEGFSPGDRVAAAGAGLANHAEIVRVPRNLVVKIPESVSFEAASTVTLGAIALQGIRRAEPRLGEFVVVLGTGLIGLLSLQMLLCCGSRVIAVDVDERRLFIASEFGGELIVNAAREDPVAAILRHTGGKGADAVLFTASTSSSAPLSQAFAMTRKKGRVVLVGVAGEPMEIRRDDIYKKELDFFISTSYGPGRYDATYEEQGLDYPYAYVRWTENRNMEEYLRQISIGAVRVEPLVSRVYPVEKADEAFRSLMFGESRPLAILLEYPKGSSVLDEQDEKRYRVEFGVVRGKVDRRIGIALIGPGGFAEGVHLPNLSKLQDKFKLRAIAGRRGEQVKDASQRWGAEYATTRYEDVLEDDGVDLIFICTRHDSHARLVLEALKAGKAVFVEKPLAVTLEELEEIEHFFLGRDEAPLLMVGFNRRFSRYTCEVRRHTDSRVNPLFMRYRMNAGYIPLDHWVHEAGGRIIGECCHAVDVLSCLAGCRIHSVSYEELTPATEYYSSSDNKSIVLKFEDGSIGHVDYFACGSTGYPKEELEVHFDDKTLVIDDYRELRGYGIEVEPIHSSQPDKGHLEELLVLHEVLKRGGPPPIELWDMFQTTRVTIMVGRGMV